MWGRTVNLTVNRSARLFRLGELNSLTAAECRPMPRLPTRVAAMDRSLSRG